MGIVSTFRIVQYRRLSLGSIRRWTVFDTTVVVEPTACAICLIVLNLYVRATRVLSSPVYNTNSQWCICFVWVWFLVCVKKINRRVSDDVS